MQTAQCQHPRLLRHSFLKSSKIGLKGVGPPCRVLPDVHSPPPPPPVMFPRRTAYYLLLTLSCLNAGSY